jgi:hypothetical protein
MIQRQQHQFIDKGQVSLYNVELYLAPVLFILLLHQDLPLLSGYLI